VNFILLKNLGESFILPETSVEKLWDEFKLFAQKFPEIISLE
jgi:hypothetical protein